MRILTAIYWKRLFKEIIKPVFGCYSDAYYGGYDMMRYSV